MTTTILSEKGQVVIPAEIRAQLGLQRGDRFEIEVRASEIVFRALPRSPLLSLRGAFKGPDSLTGELLREHQLEQRADRA